MKKMMKNVAYVAAAIFLSIATVGCEDNNTGGGSTEVDPLTKHELGDGTQRYELKEDTRLVAGTPYTMRGFVYVPNGVTLTIEPGTVIKGDKFTKGTLIVERGGKIVAEGTQANPIVFTSSEAPGQRTPGDWGGIIILGNAPNNGGEMTIEGGINSKHGGSDNNDNSGVFTYVRIEFGGIEYSTDNEINGLTLGSVGAGTTMHHIQVSYAKDDSFEWFGGTVNMSHLVALGTWDDTFDTDNGYSGKLQFLFGLNDPNYADKSSSNGFESDNNSSASIAEPFTSAVFANVTLVGPVSNPEDYSDMGSEAGSGWFQNAVQIRRNSRISLFNSVLAGYPIGVNIDNDKGSDTQGAALTRGALGGNVMAGMVYDFQDVATNKEDIRPSDATQAAVEAIWNKEGAGNLEPLATIAELDLKGDPQMLTSPNAIPNTTSPAANSAVWTNTLVESNFFDKVVYSGAFGPAESASNNWMTGWTNFDPQNTVY